MDITPIKPIYRQIDKKKQADAKPEKQKNKNRESLSLKNFPNNIGEEKKDIDIIA